MVTLLYCVPSTCKVLLWQQEAHSENAEAARPTSRAQKNKEEQGRENKGAGQSILVPPLYDSKSGSHTVLDLKNGAANGAKGARYSPSPPASLLWSELLGLKNGILLTTEVPGFPVHNPLMTPSYYATHSSSRPFHSQNIIQSPHLLRRH
eukprot:bmy_18461T0